MLMKEKTTEELVELGKAKYEKGTVAEKLETLVKMGKLDKDCGFLESLVNAVENGKPIVFYSVGTTGIKADDCATQIGITRYTLEGGKYTEDVSARKQVICFADIDKVERAIKNESSYDIFKEGGFGRPVEQNGLGFSKEEYIKELFNPALRKTVKTSEQVMDILRKDFFGQDALYVGLNPRFADPFFEKLGASKDEIEAMKAIDVLALMQEHDYNAINEGDRDPVNTTGSRYNLATIAHQYDGKWKNEEPKLYSSLNKCDAMFGIISVIGDKLHLKELVKEEVAEEKPFKGKEIIEARPTEKSKDISGYTSPLSTDISFRGRKTSEIVNERQSVVKSEVQTEEVQEILDKDNRTHELLSRLVDLMTEVVVIEKENNRLLGELNASLEKKKTTRKPKEKPAETKEAVSEKEPEQKVDEALAKGYEAGVALFETVKNTIKEIEVLAKDDDGIDR